MEKRIQSPLRSPLNPLAQLRALYSHRDLLWQFTVRNFELRHRGSALGLVWAVLNPLLMVTLYVFVFGFIYKGEFGVVENEGPWAYALGIFMGLCFHHLVSEVVAVAPQVIVGNANLVKKVVFPLEILPVATVGASVMHFLISLSLVLIGILTVGPGFSPDALWLPVVIVPVVLLAMGVSWFFAALGVFLRDISQVIAPISVIMLFTSGVFYSVQKVQSPAREILQFNPLLQAIELARDVVLWHQPMQLVPLCYIYLVGAGSCALGYWVFARARTGFADVL